MIEKTENDDKLINMLKQEISRLESTKGIKSQINAAKLSGSTADTEELIKLRGENGRLKNSVKCGEIEIS